MSRIGEDIGDVVCDVIDAAFDALADVECWLIGLYLTARGAWTHHRAPRAVLWGARPHDYQIGGPQDLEIARCRRREAELRRAQAARIRAIKAAQRTALGFANVASAVSRTIRACGVERARLEQDLTRKAPR